MRRRRFFHLRAEDQRRRRLRRNRERGAKLIGGDSLRHLSRHNRSISRAPRNQCQGEVATNRFKI